MIQLPPEVYWEFRARVRDAEVALADLQRASTERWRDDAEVLDVLRRRFDDACAHRTALLERLGEEFGMTATGSYRWDDTAHTLEVN